MPREGPPPHPALARDSRPSSRWPPFLSFGRPAVHAPREHPWPCADAHDARAGGGAEAYDEQNEEELRFLAETGQSSPGSVCAAADSRAQGRAQCEDASPRLNTHTHTHTHTQLEDAGALAAGQLYGDGEAAAKPDASGIGAREAAVVDELDAVADEIRALKLSLGLEPAGEPYTVACAGAGGGESCA